MIMPEQNGIVVYYGVHKQLKQRRLFVCFFICGLSLVLGLGNWS